MTGQIKIIIEYEEEGIDNDVDGPLSNVKVNVYRDDERIGLIQSIKFSVDANEVIPRLEFVFPNLTGWAACDELNKKIDEQVKFLSKIVGVKVLKRP